MNLQNRKRLTDLENKLMVAGVMDGGKGQLGSLGWPCTYCCFKMVLTRTYPIVLGTLLNVVWWPEWEGSLRKNGHTCMCLGPFPVLLKPP